MEAVTLHRRFPYAVLAGFFFLDKDAKSDETPKRRSTFENAHNRLRIFTGRDDPAGRDEQYERMYLVSMDANPFDPKIDTMSSEALLRDCHWRAFSTTWCGWSRSGIRTFLTT